QNIAITIAVAATRKLLSESLDEERAGALTDKAIKELPKKLH
ncbi:MAG: F0F1 ATP synthase subunit B, partial [Myxococcales bacterium]|nr:F0F1 ATP synthase subunit B [Myxococcales bacterium]